MVFLLKKFILIFLFFLFFIVIMVVLLELLCYFYKLIISFGDFIVDIGNNNNVKIVVKCDF